MRICSAMTIHCDVHVFVDTVHPVSTPVAIGSSAIGKHMCMCHFSWHERTQTAGSSHTVLYRYTLN
jgi:hypothetical protein